MYPQKMAKIGWLILFIGFNGTFLPQFILGMEGMPRRYFDYPVQFEDLHYISSCFAMFNGLGYALVFGNLFYGIFWGKKVDDNPWESLSLEWKTASPPIHENFEEIPVVDNWTYAYDLEVEDKVDSEDDSNQYGYSR